MAVHRSVVLSGGAKELSADSFSLC